MAGVWILADRREQTLELLNIGREIATRLGTRLVALVSADLNQAQEYILHGADEVLIMPPLADEQPLSAYVPVIAEEARQNDPDIFLVAGTSQGKEMAARIAARLNTGLGSDCIGLNFDETQQKLVMDRLIYGGAAVQTVVCLTCPQMATVPPRMFAPATPQNGRQGVVRELAPPPPSGVKILSRKPREHAAGDITEAKVLVCVGRGFENQADLKLAQELAETIGGVIACTRPLAEELHWLPERSYIGLSGEKVKPELYIGVGVSGQIQHTTGIRDAKVICAINRDENAPIFDTADYGIVGDLYDVLPKLTEECKKALGK
ncbi:MAG: electron transfer flavoprotein subunit alpha/FixB family protein [Firmicutes bacterium]|nr:electron transfer flavoprotein subunit alpha/FixB family protein [Bacillota bacterium]